MTISRACIVALVVGLTFGMLLIPLPGLAASPSRHAKVMTDTELDGVAAAAPTDPTHGEVVYQEDESFSDLGAYWSLLAMTGNAPVVRGEVPSNGTTFRTPTGIDTFGYAFSGLTGPGVPGGIGGIGGLGGLGGIGDITPPSLSSIGNLLGLNGNSSIPFGLSAVSGIGGNPGGSLGNVLGGLRGLGSSGASSGGTVSTGLPIRTGP